ncbi:hypothetical protein DIZ76_012911 [Coccidioides immitis]|nr:hypothetical protein DIZ76_012911 [Coccidioides immitis]
MLSRGSSANSRLKRSKSLASTNGRRRDRSFAQPIDDERAQRHALTAASLAMQRATRSSFDDSNDSEAGAHRPPVQVPRSQSIRFSDGTNAGVRKMGSIRSSPAAAHLTADDTVQEKEDGSRAQTIDNFKEFGMLDDDIPSVPSIPSSYRKLRKSKSMFSARLRTGWLTNGSRSPRRSRRQSQDTSKHHFARTPLRRSMSFFKGGDSVPPTKRHSSTNSHSPAIKLGGEQFLRDLSRTSKSDTLGPNIAGEGRREQKSLRRTLRTSTSMTNDDDPRCSTRYAEERYRDGHRSMRARLLSQSIKNGFRKIFGRHGALRGSVSPQQTDTYRPHVRASIDPEFQPDLNPSHMSTPTSHSNHPDASVFNVYRGFSGHRPASIRSMKSIDSVSTSNSRATTWTNSTMTNSINTTRPVETRLSIIEEHGDPNKPIHIQPRYHDGYSPFRQPLCLDPMANSIDSQRVYSALMRKIDGSNTLKKQSDTTNQWLEGAEAGRDNTQPPSSSQRPSQGTRQAPGEALMRYSQVVSIPPRNSPSVRSYMSTQPTYIVEYPGRTPQQIAQRNESILQHRSRRPLGRFNSNASHSSPYRHSAQYAGDTITTPTRSRYSDDDSRTVVVLNSPPSDSFVVSPSVYSRTTNTPGGHQNNIDFAFSELDEDRGTATIIGRETLPSTPRGRDRIFRGSAEWKSWMNSQMELIDRPSLSNELDIKFSASDRMHYREDADIHGEISDDEPSCGFRKVNRNKICVKSPRCEDRVSNNEGHALTELSTISQNNFSRPLHRSPSGPVSIGATNARKPSLVTHQHTPPCSAPVVVDMNVPSTGSSRSRSKSKAPNQSPLIYNKTRQPESRKSLTVSPLDGRNPRTSLSTRSRHDGNVPPPFYGADVTRRMPSVKYSSTRSRGGDGLMAKENREGNENNPPDRNEFAEGFSKIRDLHSTISSKRMVDLFLSDRRRLMGGADSPTESAFI